MREQMLRRTSSSRAVHEVASQQEASAMIDRPGETATGPMASGITSTAATPGAPTPIYTPGTRRAMPAVNDSKYRAVFACCTQAGEPPTE